MLICVKQFAVAAKVTHVFIECFAPVFYVDACPTLPKNLLLQLKITRTLIRWLLCVSRLFLLAGVLCKKPTLKHVVRRAIKCTSCSEAFFLRRGWCVTFGEGFMDP